jgi:hypothetical protein
MERKGDWILTYLPLRFLALFAVNYIVFIF